MSFDYKKAGVDVDAGDELVDWLARDKTPTPYKNNIISGIGGFASLFRLDLQNYKKPCIITCTDGVGTKVLLAAEYGAKPGYLECVAQDMVAMCVNDLVTTGGDPLMFLDYYATSKLDLMAAQKFLTGVKKACLESECALVGGETAEMPGVYKDKDFDCAGFAVGIVDEEKVLGPARVTEGDCVIGVSSNGFHSNGYSLLRKVFEKDLRDWLDVLMMPTHLYVKLSKALREWDVHAFAHITGGGVLNIPRVMPENLKLVLKPWAWPEEFMEVQRRTAMTNQKMLETLNCGIGFVVFAKNSEKKNIENKIQQMGFKCFDLGVLEKKDPSEEQLVY